MTTQQLQKFIDLVSLLPSELQNLMISYSMHTFDVLKNNKLFIDYLKLNPNFKLDVYPDDDAGYFNIQSVYSNDGGGVGDGKSVIVKSLDNYMTLFETFKIESMVVSQAYSNDQWKQLVPWAKSIIVRRYNPDKLKEWGIPLDKIQTITCFEVSLISKIIEQLIELSNIKTVKIFVLEPLLSDAIDNIIQLSKSVKQLILEHPAIHLRFFTPEAISKLSKVPNIELEMPYFMPPYTDVSFLNSFTNFSTGTFLLNSIDELNYLEKFNKIGTLVFKEIKKLKDLKFMVKKVNELKLIDTETIQNCDFSNLKGLKEVTLDAQIDPKTLSTLPGTVNTLYLCLSSQGTYNNSVSGIYTLPKSIRDLTVDGIQTLKLMDLTSCCYLESIFLCGLPQESVTGISESDDVWNTISELVETISISIAPIKGSTDGKVFGMKVCKQRDPDNPLFLEINSSHTLLVVINADSTGSDGLIDDEFTNAINTLGMPYCIFNGIDNFVTIASPTDNVRLLCRKNIVVKTQNGHSSPFTELTKEEELIPGFTLMTSCVSELSNRRKHDEVDDDGEPVEGSDYKIRRLDEIQ